MLNVGDGDATIIYLKRNSEDQLIILIDGGHAGDANNVISNLSQFLKDANKKAPDLIICTHYDADHIGGLKTIVETYGAAIGELWIHQPGLQLAAIELAGKILESRKRTVNFETYKEVAPFEDESRDEGLLREVNLILESYEQMRRLVIYLRQTGIKTVEPFNTTKLASWPELSVLGPTKKFYTSCYNKISSPHKLLLNEARNIRDEKDLDKSINSLLLKESLANPCEFLDQQRKDRVTEVNQVSVILQITINKNKYLFTGDASLESFENIPNYPEVLQNCYFFKVAHHGSHNNSSSKLFDIINPKYAFMSGGNRYLDDEVKECLQKKGAIVKTTRDDGDLDFPE